MVECYDQILEVIESYDPSFLKVIQLLIDGDVESNPGPTQNQNSKSPGWQKKSNAFNFKKQRADNEIDLNISSNVRNPNIPLGLLNRGENVCFFNCVVQVLYAIPAFRDFLQGLTLGYEAVIAIKEMFEEISTSNEPVRTSKYVQDLGLTEYRFHEQYDAHECITQFLNNIYPTITDDCMFKVQKLESIVCRDGKLLNEEGEEIPCRHKKDTVIPGIDLKLEVEDMRNIQTVSGLINKVQSTDILKHYKCDSCDTRGTSTKADFITHTSDVLIIHLKIFKYITESQVIKKIIPNLTIEN